MDITVIDGNNTEHLLAVNENQSLLSALQQGGFSVRATCGGKGTCKKCTVSLTDDQGTRQVLACMTPCKQNLVVTLPKEETLSIEDASPLAAERTCSIDAGLTGLGLAVDLGTTTIACYLFDLASGKQLACGGAANPQAIFGADVISRISACNDGNLSILQEQVATCIDNLSEQLCKRAGVEPTDIYRRAIAGNTVMEHILCNLSPESIGISPFTPLSLFGDTHIIEHLSDDVFVSPCVAGYVGGDISAGLLACGLDKRKGAHLFADLGTNGELALAVDGTIYCCATATGPAFEGSNIHMGMQARPGAITTCDWSDGAFVLKTIDDADAVGICGAGIISVLACCLSLGLIDETGRIADDDEVDENLQHLLIEYDDKAAIKLVDDGSVFITQGDVRAVQLAKAAVFAGLQTLLRSANLTEQDIATLFIGGAFGAHMDSAAAARVGIFPGVLLSRVKMVGNCAGEGICEALLSREARQRLQDIAHNAHYTELSTDARFAATYTEAMMFDEEF